MQSAVRPGPGGRPGDLGLLPGTRQTLFFELTGGTCQKRRRSRSLVDALRKSLEGHRRELAERGEGKQPLAQGIACVPERWEGFTVFPEDGRIEPGTNLLEQENRALKHGTGAWNFVGSMKGFETTCIMFTLIGTCKPDRVNPLECLSDVSGRIGRTPEDRMRELLPWNWQPGRGNEAE